MGSDPGRPAADLRDDGQRGDRIVDNQKVRAYLAPLLGRPGNRSLEIAAGHAVQFERPDELAAALLEFIRGTGAPA